MALTPQPTLLEMTAAVLDAVGEGGTGVAAPGTQAMVQSLIRRAQAQVQDEAEWTISRVTTTANLPAGEMTIEWPDDSQPGNIMGITAQRATSPQFIWDLIAGISTDDRSAWINSGAASAYAYSPTKFEYLNGMIEVGPACTQDITLTITYGLGSAILVSEGDRPNCDGLAIIMQAEILFRNARGGDFRAAIPKLQADYQKRLMAQKSRQGTGKQFVPGEAWNLTDPARRGDGRRQRHWMYRDVRP